MIRGLFALAALAPLLPSVSSAESLPTNTHFRYSFTFGQFRSNMPIDNTAFDVRYVSRIKDGKVSVFPQSSYLAYIANSNPILGTYYWHTPFNWRLPTLSLKFANATEHIAALTSLEIHVSASTVDETPVPIIPAYINTGIGQLTVVNEGWGAMLKTKVRLKIVSNDDCLSADVSNEITGEPLQLGTIERRTSVDVSKLVPAELVDEPVVCAAGYLDYQNKAGKPYSLPFMAPVNLVSPTPGAPLPPSAAYRLWLEAGKAGYDVTVPISHTVEANGAEHILLTVSTDRSATFDLSIQARMTDSTLVDMGDIALKVFRPRSANDAPERPPISQFLNIALPTASRELSTSFSRIAANPMDPTDIIAVAAEDWELRKESEKQMIEAELSSQLAKAGYAEGRICVVNSDSECGASFNLGAQ